MVRPDNRLFVLLAILCSHPGCRCQRDDGKRPIDQARQPRAEARPASTAEILTAAQRRLGALPCPPPMRVDVGNVDGAGRPEIVIACDDALLVLEASGALRARAATRGWPQELLVTDIDGDGASELITGWGTSRRRQNARARLLLHRVKGDALSETPLLIPETSRNEIAGVALESAGKNWSLAVAHFTSKYTVRHLRLRGSRSGVQAEELGSWRMATSSALGRFTADKHQLVVGRLYGDALGDDGDAFVLVDNKRLPIPTTRGVRSIAVADLDRDGRDEVLLADGWSQRYAQQGRAMLTLASWTGKTFETRLLLQIPGEYTINRVRVVDVNHDGTPELLLVGSATTRLFHKRGDRWEGRLLSKQAGDAAAIDIDGDGLDEVVVVGKTATIVRLEGVPPAR